MAKLQVNSISQLEIEFRIESLISKFTIINLKNGLT